MRKTQHFEDDWVRQAERELKLSNEIPDGITGIIILYYRIVEYFEVIGEGVTVSNEGQMLKRYKQASGDSVSYGKVQIDSTSSSMHRWDVKIQHSRFINIGIVSFVKETNLSWLRRSGGYYYGFYSNKSNQRFSCSRTQNDDYRSLGTLSYQDISDRVFSVHFDAKKSELGYSIDGSKATMTHTDICRGKENEIKYRLIVGLSQQNDSAELMGYFETCD